MHKLSWESDSSQPGSVAGGPTGVMEQSPERSLDVSRCEAAEVGLVVKKSGAVDSSTRNKPHDICEQRLHLFTYVTYEHM